MWRQILNSVLTGCFTKSDSSTVKSESGKSTKSVNSQRRSIATPWQLRSIPLISLADQQFTPSIVFSPLLVVSESVPAVLPDTDETELNCSSSPPGVTAERHCATWTPSPSFSCSLHNCTETLVTNPPSLLTHERETMSPNTENSGTLTEFIASPVDQIDFLIRYTLTSDRNILTATSMTVANELLEHWKWINPPGL